MPKLSKKKLLMIHADDAGLSTSENQATIKALGAGLVTSYSIMVPCAWFYEMAQFALANPQFDYGIHLTLTCEWKNYKFGPVLPLEQVQSLVDKNGHFHKTRETLKSIAKGKEVEKELSAQIEKALNLGLKPSHLDCHMYSVAIDPEIISIYKNLGKKYDLPVLLSKELMTFVNYGAETAIEEDDLLVDKIYVGEFKYFEQGNLKKFYDDILDNLQTGFNMILIHPAFDTNEMKSITEDHSNFGSEWRQLDFDYFTSEECRSKIEENGIQLVSWKEIKSLMTNNINHD